MKLRAMALDPNAQQALQISLSGDREIYKVDNFDISSLVSGSDAINIIVTSHLDNESLKLLELIQDIDAKNILIYPDSEESSKYINRLFEIKIIPSPIKIESLTTVALSSTLDIFIDIISEPKDEDIIFGIYNIEDIFRDNFFVSTWTQSGSSIESAMLKLVRGAWEIGSAYGIAMAIHVPPEMTLITLDELLDLIESRISSNTKLYIVYKNDLSQDEKPYINLILSRYLPKDTSFQDFLDKEEGYLSKMALIIDWFNSGALNGTQADMLAKDNGIEPSDLQRVYSIVYEYPQSVASIIKELREAPNDTYKIDIIINAVKDGVIDTIILEELAHTHNLPIDLIVKKMEMESKE